MADMMLACRVVRQAEPVLINNPLEDIWNLLGLASPFGDDQSSVVSLFVAESIARATIWAIRATGASLKTMSMIVYAFFDTHIVKSITIFHTRTNFGVTELFTLNSVIEEQPRSLHTLPASSSQISSQFCGHCHLSQGHPHMQFKWHGQFSKHVSWSLRHLWILS